MSPLPPALPGRRVERVLVVVGALAVVTAAAVWAVVPPPPPTKGLGAAVPRLDVLLAFFAGAALVAGTARAAAEAWRTRAWPVVHGVLTEVRPVGGPYVYLAGTYTVGERSYALQDVRGRFEGRYREGDPVVVRYDPAAPDRSALQPAVSRATVATLVVGSLLLVGSGAALVAPSVV